MACVNPVYYYRESLWAQIRPDLFPADPGRMGVPRRVPCGKCLGCRRSRLQGWLVRSVHEASLHRENCFITLTYDEQHLPGDLSVSPRPWQLFAKRLRKERGRFRYLACGEYGEKSLRPHYHACLFGIDFDDRIRLRTGARPLWTSPSLQRLWPSGNVSLGSFTPATAAYVAGYVMKKAYAPQTTERVNPRTGEVWDVRPPFITMSRGRRSAGEGGLGYRWFERYRADCYPHDNVVVEGTRYAAPRYYDDLLGRADPGALLSVKERRRERQRERSADYSRYHLDSRAGDLLAREMLYNQRNAL